VRPPPRDDDQVPKCLLHSPPPKPRIVADQVLQSTVPRTLLAALVRLAAGAFFDNLRSGGCDHRRLGRENTKMDGLLR
jgi:hypothetical protein